MISTSDQVAAVLWVGPTHSTVYQAFCSAAASAQLPSQAIPNPYAALAWLSKHRDAAGSGLLAVALHLERLETRDLEFLQIVARQCPRLTLWVTADDDAAGLLEAALRVGGQQRLTSVNAAALMMAVAARREISNVPVPSGPTAGSDAAEIGLSVQPIVNPTLSGSVEPKETGTPAMDGPVSTPCGVRNGEALSRPQPVPWTRNPDAPVRTPPTRPEQKEVQRIVESTEADLPLLTDEEMETLIGREARRRESRS